MRSIRSITRGLDIIRALNGHGGLTLTQITNITGLARGTAYRMLYTLRELGYVLRDEHTGAHHLTQKIMSLSNGYDAENWPSKIAKPVMVELGNLVNWPVVLSTLQGKTVIIRENTDRDTPMVFNVIKGGYRLPVLGSASGWVLLAHCKDHERETIISLIERFKEEGYDLAARRDLMASTLEKIRNEGHHILARPAIKSSVISVPVLQADGKALAALSIRYFSSAVPAEDVLEHFAPSMQKAADQIAHAYHAWQGLTQPAAREDCHDT